MIEKYKGIITKIKYENNDNFYILEVQNKDKENHVIQGHAQNLRTGEHFEADGMWITRRGKKVLDCICIESTIPTEEENILSYLSSGIIKGIGKATAKGIVDLFSTNSINVIDKNPEWLIRVPKIGQKLITKIIESWEEVKPSQQVVSEMIRLGFRDFEAIKIYKYFGIESMYMLRNYPYNICKHVPTLSFKNLDFIVLKMGFQHDSVIRINAAINYFIYEIQSNGDCIANKNEVIKQTLQYLKTVSAQTIEQAIDAGISKAIFHVITKLDNDLNDVVFIQTSKMRDYELELAKRLFILSNTEIKDLPKIEKINFIEKKLSFTEEQEIAIKGALNNKLSVITGKPGVGKTTVINEVINQFKALNKNILLCAPTGKAAQKMTESSGEEASTIHRLLKFNPMKDGFSVNEENPLVTDVIIIDEASMIDIFLIVYLLRALPMTTQIVIIGDIGQLPSVTSGAVLRDIIQCKKIPVFTIKKIMRQKGTSSIITNAHSIDNGEFDFDKKYSKDNKEDFYFIPTFSDSDTMQKMESIIKNKIKNTFNYNPQKDVQVLAATHKGELGNEALNVNLQSILNTGSDYEAITRGGFKYKRDDKVIQIVNNYDKDVFNGDTGVIEALNENGIYVVFENGKEAEYTIREMEELLPSYSITGHKSQGSEYPVVIIPLPQIYTQVIDRSWIYTTITRGKAIVIVIGSKEVFERGIKSEKSRHRITDLQNKIEDIFNTHISL